MSGKKQQTTLSYDAMAHQGNKVSNKLLPYPKIVQKFTFSSSIQAKQFEEVRCGETH